MKKQFFVVLAIIFIGAAAYYFFGQSTPDDLKGLLGADPKLYLYTIEGASTGQLNVSVPFTKNVAGKFAVNVALDADSDGKILDNEWQVKDSGAFPSQNLKNHYWLADDTKKLAVGNEVLDDHLLQVAELSVHLREGGD